MTTDPLLEGSRFPVAESAYAKGDVLKHHSVPGFYHVLDVTHDGKLVLLDPRGERQRVWAYYVDENFKAVDRG